MNKEKSCNTCERGMRLHLTKDILCKYHGVVTQDFVCSKYKDGSAALQSNYRCIHCEYFLVGLDSINQDVGKCKLFSSREFNGTSRNVCSRFSKKMLIEVS